MLIAIPIPDVKIADNAGHAAITAPDGFYKIAGLIHRHLHPHAYYEWLHLHTRNAHGQCATQYDGTGFHGDTTPTSVR